MRIVDITHGFYADMPSYNASWYPRFAIQSVMTPETDPSGEGRTFTQLNIFAHNATHVDVPIHFFRNLATLDQVGLEPFIGRACVADLSDKRPEEPITAADLERAIGDVWQPGSRVLIRTDYLSRHWGRPDFWDRPPYLTPSAAEWLVHNKALLVGLDCITDKASDSTSPVHKRLLGNGVLLLEYITNLHDVQEKVVYLVALPTKVAGVEAAPVRAVVIEGCPGVA